MVLFLFLILEELYVQVFDCACAIVKFLHQNRVGFATIHYAVYRFQFWGDRFLHLVFWWFHPAFLIGLWVRWLFMWLVCSHNPLPWGFPAIWGWWGRWGREVNSQQNGGVVWISSVKNKIFLFYMNHSAIIPNLLKVFLR